MNNNYEFEEKDIVICDFEDERDTNIDGFTFQFEVWFDVERKFNIHLDEGDWVNAYIVYTDRIKDKIYVLYVIDKEDDCEYDSYIPTYTERELLLNKVKEYISDNNIHHKGLNI